MKTDDLQARILASRGPARLWLALESRQRVDDAAEVAGLVERSGLTLPEGGWRTISRRVAAETIARFLERSQAYAEPRMSREAADAYASEFVRQFSEDATFLTNLGDPPRNSTWSPMTGHTFDAGVVALDAVQVGLICVADED